MVDADVDRTGFDDTRNHLAEALGRFVPQSIARRVIAVTVSTDRHAYAPGESVKIDIEFRNRLPVPVTITTPQARIWAWAVDGTLEASEERRCLRPVEATLNFRAGERKRLTREWGGTIRRLGSPDTWEELAPGTHEISAFIAVEGRPRPEDSTLIEIG